MAHDEIEKASACTFLKATSMTRAGWATCSEMANAANTWLEVKEANEVGKMQMFWSLESPGTGPVHGYAFFCDVWLVGGFGHACFMYNVKSAPTAGSGAPVTFCVKRSCRKPMVSVS